MKVMLFGAGKALDNVMREMETMTHFAEDEIVAIADNDINLRETFRKGIQIITPQEIQHYRFDRIIITTGKFESAIRSQLVEELNIDANSIMGYESYKKSKFAEAVYRKHYGPSGKGKKNIFTDKKIVVYTCITGNYDGLKAPLFQAEDITYVCFTNNREIKSSVWNMEYIDRKDADNVLLARQIKTSPHILFPEYETSVWVDGKFEIKEDLRKYIEIYGGKKPILCFPHHVRRCIYDEAAACLMYGKGEKSDIIKQISHYYAAGYPFDNGLYESGCIVRKHNHDMVKEMMTEWKTEIINYSIRDQLSLPYIFWKFGFVPDISNLYVGHNRWLQIYKHTK